MRFARLFYEDAYEWGIVEEKYVRLIDAAPWEDWRYSGAQVRTARAKFHPASTGQLICVQEHGMRRKNASRVLPPSETLPCPPAGMDCLCGLAAVLGADGAIFGYTLANGFSVGPYVTDTLPDAETLTISVGEDARRTDSAHMLKDRLAQAVAQAAADCALCMGDVVALCLPAGRVLPTEVLHMEIPSIGTLRAATIQRGK